MINCTAAGKFLVGREFNCTSQWGEDGLIAAIFERIGAVNQWCFEVGAADGLLYSNTLALRCKGWNAILIKADDREYRRLTFFANPKIRCVHQVVNSKSLDVLLDSFAAPRDMDLGIIDVDGPDYWVWHGMRNYKPRVMIVEFAPDHLRSEDHICKDDKANWEDQSGKNAIVSLGIDKGYIHLGTTGYNSLFVRSDCL